MRITNMTHFMSTRFSIQRNDVADKGIRSNTNVNGDTVSISNFGRNALSRQNRTSNILESLFKQKQSIMDSRSKLIERTTENGKSLDSIKSQLEEYEEQLTNIDEQIAKYMLQEEQKALGIDKKEDKASDKKPKTEEEIENERLSGILSLSGDVSQMQVASSAKGKMKGQAKILKKEIELDEARSISGQKATAKRAQLSKINESLSNVEEKIGETIKAINEKIKDNVDNEENSTSKKSDKPSNEPTSETSANKEEKVQL